MKDQIVLYRDAQNEWRWRIIAAENGKIIARSSEGYENEDEARENITRVTSVASRAFTFHYE